MRITHVFTGSAFLIMLLSLFFSPVLPAHTSLVASLPADRQVLLRSPKALQLSFSDPVRLMRLTLRNAQGDKLAVNYRPKGELANEHSHTLPQTLDVGHYNLEWSVMARDGHSMRGKISFAVMPSAEPSASMGKEPSASMGKEPSASMGKEPSASMGKEPSASMNKEPSTKKTAQ